MKTYAYVGALCREFHTTVNKARRDQLRRYLNAKGVPRRSEAIYAPFDYEAAKAVMPKFLATLKRRKAVEYTQAAPEAHNGHESPPEARETLSDMEAAANTLLLSIAQALAQFREAKATPRRRSSDATH